MLKESLRMSWQNIRANKMRSFLTILGIVIGVTAIIALITTVESATHEMTRQFSELGAGKVSISVSGTALKSGLTEADLERLSALENIESLDPTVSFTRHVSNGQRLAEDITIEGRNAVYFQRTDDLISAGRGLTPMDMDRNSHVCVIDTTLRSALYPGEDPLGKTLIVGGQRFTIVGLLSDDSSDVMSVMFSSGDNGKVILPFQAAQRMIHSNSVTSLGVYIRDTDRTDETIDDMEGVLNAAFNYKDDAYRIINLESLLDTMDTMLGMMTTMLAGIASIALLVGGIGIMNMMLVSVSERTTEIGLRKALGARPKTIQMQFLLEAVMLSLLGGIIGILLGNLLSLLFAVWLQVDFELSTGAILLAFLFSATVGIIFGWAPARKASRLNPIDALRSM